MADHPTATAAQRYYDEQRARRNRPEGDTMSTTTQATERTADHDSVERDVEAIEQALDHLSRLMADRSMRWNNAAAAGATLAYEVERFLDDPEGVGTDALRAAWSTFMGRHSGNFTDSAMAARRPQMSDETTRATAAPLTLQELATLAARVVAHMPYATMRGRDSEQAYYDAKALRDALHLIDPQIVRRNHLAPGQRRPHWPDDKGCPP